MLAHTFAANTCSGSRSSSPFRPPLPSCREGPGRNRSHSSTEQWPSHWTARRPRCREGSRPRPRRACPPGCADEASDATGRRACYPTRRAAAVRLVSRGAVLRLETAPRIQGIGCGEIPVSSGPQDPTRPAGVGPTCWRARSDVRLRRRACPAEARSWLIRERRREGWPSGRWRWS